MFKRILAAILLVVTLAIAPVTAAAPAERLVNDQGDLAGFVQAVWEDFAHFLGFGPSPRTIEPERADEPRSRGDLETVGPHIDP